MSKQRGFEVVTAYKDKGIILPQRATAQSAGYDIAAAGDIVVPSIWQTMKEVLMNEGNAIDIKVDQSPNGLVSTLVPTGIKAFMPKDEYLLLANRSSNPMKHQLALPNGIGVIDADYYNNASNEGEIFVQLINYGLEDYTIKKGDRIAQGIFTPYLKTDEQNTDHKERLGGFGSSGM